MGTMPSDFSLLPKQLGCTVRKLRIEAGMSQLVLAEKADLALNFVGEIERGEKNASLETTLRLARALGISGAELLNHVGV
jgi:transcriptional regulator with XRE-family HTH domain